MKEIGKMNCCITVVSFYLACVIYFSWWEHTPWFKHQVECKLEKSNIGKVNDRS